MAEYSWASGPESLAAELIEQHHPHLVDLPIAYIFKSVAPKKKKKGADENAAPKRQKKVTLAKASKVSEKNKILMQRPYEFVIEIDHVNWENWFDFPEKQLALLDHELCHCGNDADGTYTIKHGLEEFPEIATRHGLWLNDVATFAQAVDKPYHEAHGGHAHEDGPVTVDDSTVENEGEIYG